MEDKIISKLIEEGKWSDKTTRVIIHFTYSWNWFINILFRSFASLFKGEICLQLPFSMPVSSAWDIRVTLALAQVKKSYFFSIFVIVYKTEIMCPWQVWLLQSKEDQELLTFMV